MTLVAIAGSPYARQVVTKTHVVQRRPTLLRRVRRAVHLLYFTHADSAIEGRKQLGVTLWRVTPKDEAPQGADENLIVESPGLATVVADAS